MTVQEKVRMAWASLSRGERKRIRMKARTSPEAVVRNHGKIVLRRVQRVRPATIARDCMAVFRTRYNEYRPHWALALAEGGDPLTPHDVYGSGWATKIPKWPGWAKGAKQRLDALMGRTAVPETRAS